MSRRAFTCNFKRRVDGGTCPNCGGPAAEHEPPSRAQSAPQRAAYQPPRRGTYEKPQERPGARSPGAPAPIGGLAAEIVARAAAPDPRHPQGKLRLNWKRILGPDADRCEPMWRPGDTLLITTDSCITAMELQLCTDELLAEFAKLLGPDAPKRLRFSERRFNPGRAL